MHSGDWGGYVEHTPAWIFFSIDTIKVSVIQSPIGSQGDDVGAYFHIQLSIFTKFNFLDI